MNGLSAEEKIHLFARLGDMELVGYRNTLAVVAIIELLVQKGLITRDEVASKARSLDEELDRELDPTAVVAGAAAGRAHPAGAGAGAGPGRLHPGNSGAAADSGSTPSTSSR